MKIELRKVSDIWPYDKNPRQNDGAVEAVAGGFPLNDQTPDASSCAGVVGTERLGDVTL